MTLESSEDNTMTSGRMVDVVQKSQEYDRCDNLFVLK